MPAYVTPLVYTMKLTATLYKQSDIQAHMGCSRIVGYFEHLLESLRFDWL